MSQQVLPGFLLNEHGRGPVTGAPEGASRASVQTHSLLGLSRQEPVPQQSSRVEEMRFCRVLASVYFTKAAVCLCAHVPGNLHTAELWPFPTLTAQESPLSHVVWGTGSPCAEKSRWGYQSQS